MKTSITYFIVLISAIMLHNCKQNENYYSTPNKQIQKPEIHKIEVKETLNGGNYSYLNVNENGKKYWMAIPNTNIIIGETYYYDDGMKMTNFESKELERTFKSIIFADGIRTTEQYSPPANSNNYNTESIIKIEQPADGTSLEKLFSNKASFSNKTIVIKGKVVKINIGIMDKNWVHISDGTQFDGKKSLTVTTQEAPKVGDTVTFKGTIILNKNFGQGYIYDIILEDGKLVQ